MSRDSCNPNIVKLVGCIALLVIAIVAIVLVSVYAPVLLVGVVIFVKVIGSLAIIANAVGIFFTAGRMISWRE